MSECGTQHVFPTIYPPGPKTLDINQRCLCGLVRYGFVEIDLQQRIADLEQRLAQAEKERNEYQVAAGKWIDKFLALRDERDALAAQNAQLRSLIERSADECDIPGCQHCRWLGYEMGKRDARTPAEAPERQRQIMAVVQGESVPDGIADT